MTTSSARLPKKWSRTSTQAMSVPMTTLSAVTSGAWPMVSRIAAARLGVGDRVPERRPAALGRLDDHGAQRDAARAG